MLLQYIFFQKFRNIENQGFNLSGRFNINTSKNRVTIEESSFYIEDFFGQAVRDIKILVGENGVGKTSILTFIKEELCFPKSGKDEEAKCLVVLFDVHTKKFVFATNGINAHNFEFQIPKGYRKQVSDLTYRRNLNQEYIIKKSILGSVREFNPSSLILLSNVFENKGGKEYGYPESPFIYDVSTNSLVARSTIDPPRRSLKSSITYNAMKFILLTRDSSFIPVVHLPEEIRVTVNRALINEFIRGQERIRKVQPAR